MENLTNEEYQEIVEDYNSGKLKIFIELSLARKLLNSMDSTTTIIWNSSFTIATILSFFVGIYSIGLIGIAYGILFSIIFSSYIGLCSIEYKYKKTIYIISLIGLGISFLFPWKIMLLLIFTFGNFASVYLFYSYISDEIIKLSMSSKRMFMANIEDGIIICKRD